MGGETKLQVLYSRWLPDENTIQLVRVTNDLPASSVLLGETVWARNAGQRAKLRWVVVVVQVCRCSGHHVGIDSPERRLAQSTHT